MRATISLKLPYTMCAADVSIVVLVVRGTLALTASFGHLDPGLLLYMLTVSSSIRLVSCHQTTITVGMVSRSAEWLIFSSLVRLKIVEKGLWFYKKRGILEVTDQLLIREERYFSQAMMLIAKDG